MVMELEARMFKAYAKGDEKIQLKIIPGHFVTSQSHISHYLDMTTMKTRCAEASRIARLLSSRYETSTPVDSIICMDGLEVIGAFLAEELAKAGVLSMNAHKTIYIVTPEFNSNGQMIFRDNTKLMVEGKNVLILSTSITTGVTLDKAITSIRYYGGKVRGIAAVFSFVNKAMVDEDRVVEVNSIFTGKDLNGYASYDAKKCPMCAAKQKIDAIVNGYGYSKF